MNDKYREIARKMRGPLAPIMTPLDEQDQVDHESLRRWVDWMVSQEVPVLWTTGGTSEMLALTEQEVFGLTGTVCEANAGRAFLIASTPPLWQVDKAIELVKFTQRAGATAVKVQLNWQGGPKPNEVFDYYRRVADATDMPILVYTVGQPGMSVDLLVRLAEAIPQVIGIKNDTDDCYLHTAYLEALPEDFGVLTGGMQRPMVLGYHFGQRCYADAYAMFAPHVAWSFFNSLEQGDVVAAVDVIRQYEIPWSDLLIFGRRKLDSKAAMKTVLWLTGHFETNRVRFPRTSLDPGGAEVGLVRQFLQQVGVETVR